MTAARCDQWHAMARCYRGNDRQRHRKRKRGRETTEREENTILLDSWQNVNLHFITMPLVLAMIKTDAFTANELAGLSWCKHTVFYSLNYFNCHCLHATSRDPSLRTVTAVMLVKLDPSQNLHLCELNLSRTFIHTHTDTYFHSCCSSLCFLANQVNMFALWPHVLLGHLIDPWWACGRKQKSLWVGVGVWSEAQRTETYFTNLTYMTTPYQSFNLAMIYLVELYFFVKKNKKP